MSDHRAAILLGSNIEPETYLPEAIDKLNGDPHFDVVALSSIYATDPVGPPGQPPFLNAAVVVDTDLPPGELRAELRSIEADLGRIRTVDEFEARTIDLDILLYDDLVADFGEWQLPDTEALQAPHAVTPLAEIAPEWIHPQTGAPLGDIASRLEGEISPTLLIRLISSDQDGGRHLRQAGFLVDDRPISPPRLPGLSADAVVIDLNRAPSTGRDVGLFIRRRAATRDVPLVFVADRDESFAGVRELLPDAAFVTWNDLPTAVRDAIENPSTNPVVPSSGMAGYSRTPLPKKLGIGPGTVTCVVGAPDGFEPTLGDLPDGAHVRWSNRGNRDLTIWFTRSARELSSRLPRMRQVVGDGKLWIAWPKKASGVATDLDGNLVRQAGLGVGLVDYKVAALDETWSGLLFTARKL